MKRKIYTTCWGCREDGECYGVSVTFLPNTDDEETKHYGLYGKSIYDNTIHDGTLGSQICWESGSTITATPKTFEKIMRRYISKLKRDFLKQYEDYSRPWYEFFPLKEVQNEE